jgi:hypothetical protein
MAGVRGHRRRWPPTSCRSGVRAAPVAPRRHAWAPRAERVKRAEGAALWASRSATMSGERERGGLQRGRE